jgi:ABC-type transport system substrate-binding protein
MPGMMRTAILTTVLTAGLLFSTSVAAQSTPQATEAEAAPFLGEWTLTMQGPNGPGVFDLNVKVEEAKVVGEIIGEGLAPQKITDIGAADKNLILRYSFDYQGNAVAAVVTLTPAADGKTSAQIDFAGGAYLMTGTAAKKAPPKQ